MHSNQNLLSHANVTMGEARGGTQGVQGVNWTPDEVGGSQLATNEPDFAVGWVCGIVETGFLDEGTWVGTRGSRGWVSLLVYPWMFNVRSR